MNREQIIEAMARAVDPEDFEAWLSDSNNPEYEPDYHDVCKDELGHYIECASLALAALETAIPGLADVISGKAVVVPVEPTEAMMMAGNMPLGCRRDCNLGVIRAANTYRAMIEARPK